MEIMGLKALVTGGTGFIGSNLIKDLITREWEVYALVRNNSTLGYKRLNEIKNINYVYAEDLFNYDYDKSVKILKGNIRGKIILPQFDVCFHIASYGVDYRQQNINEIIDGNIKFTIDVLNFCKENRTKKVVNTGSCFEYGINEKEKLTEEHNVRPQSLYGAAKASAVMIANTYAKKYNIPLVTLRPFGIFGENEGIHKLVPQIMKAIILNERLKMTFGEQIRDYLYIEDLVNAYIAIGSHSVPLYEVYNVCSSSEMSIKELVVKTVDIAKSDLELFEFGAVPYRKDEVMYFVGENWKMREYTGWKPQYSLVEGLQRTYEWYKLNLEEML